MKANDIIKAGIVYRCKGYKDGRTYLAILKDSGMNLTKAAALEVAKKHFKARTDRYVIANAWIDDGELYIGKGKTSEHASACWAVYLK